jgi:ectoine hydroxylase-related dioxygenase (phytanoyl-CoA dioxygenase family)
MDTRTALEQLGVEDLTDEQRSQLDENGYFSIENAFSEEECERMVAEVERIVAAEGGGAGEVSVESGATRISNIFNKSKAFDCLLEIKPLLAASHYLLGEIKVHGANMREPHQGSGGQPLHSDSVKLHDGRWCLVNSLIAFDPMTLENGPTRVVPGSHKWAPLNVPGENAVYTTAKPRTGPAKWATAEDNVAEHVAESPVTGDTDKAPADPFAPYPGEVKVTVPARSVVVCNAHMWHSGTLKHTAARRRQLHLSYTRRDLPQQLIQRNYVTAELYNRLSEAQRYLLDLI